MVRFILLTFTVLVLTLSAQAKDVEPKRVEEPKPPMPKPPMPKREVPKRSIHLRFRLRFGDKRLTKIDELAKKMGVRLPPPNDNFRPKDGRQLEEFVDAVNKELKHPVAFYASIRGH